MGKLRIDRIKQFTLMWTDDDLHKLIRQRLHHFSTNKSRPYTRLAELSRDIDDLDEQLVRAAKGNPRTLLALCNGLISEHCKLPVTEDNLQLTMQDLKHVLANTSLSVPTVPKSVDPTATQPEALPTPIEVLLLRFKHEQISAQRLMYAFTALQAIIQFVGVTLLALYKKSDSAEPKLDDDIHRLLFTSGKPPSLGSWKMVIELISKRKQVVSSVLMESALVFRNNKDSWIQVGRMIEWRNANAHSRAADVSLREIDNSMDVIVGALSGFRQLHLVSVENHTVDDDGTIIHYVKTHMGNIQVPKLEQLKFPTNYKKGHIVLWDPISGSSVDLWPLILYEGQESLLDERGICIYDRMVGSEARPGSLAVQYVNIVSGHEVRITDPTPLFQSMKLQKPEDTTV